MGLLLCDVPEEGIVSAVDADKLDSIGAVGIGRAFLFAGEVGARLRRVELLPRDGDIGALGKRLGALEVADDLVGIALAVQPGLEEALGEVLAEDAVARVAHPIT